MNFEDKYIDELIYLRQTARENKDWKLSDEIRDYLDSKLVFVFDTKDSQQVYYFPYKYPFDEVHHYGEQTIIKKRDKDDEIIPAWIEKRFREAGQFDRIIIESDEKEIRVVIPAWSETQFEKMERLHKVKLAGPNVNTLNV